MNHFIKNPHSLIVKIERDASFLQRHNIVDYSLLIGMQRNFPQNNHLDERIINSREGFENPTDKTKAESRKISSNERRAIWSSLVRLVDESSIDKELQTEDQMMLEKMRIESRLSNMSALGKSSKKKMTEKSDIVHIWV